jgi:hypothetical protein
VETRGGEQMLWHNGGIPNYYSYPAILPERRLGIVFLANALEVLLGAQFDAIPLGMIDLLQGREPRVGRDAPFHPPVGLGMFIALLILGCQLVWVTASAVVKHPWSRATKAGPARCRSGKPSAWWACLWC